MVQKIVLVEDDHDLRFLYKDKLERNGFTVFAAADGEEGFEIIKRHKPRIILLDLLLPLLNGPDMLARVRSEAWGSDVRVIILTNISKDEAPPALRFLRVDRYIVKAHYTPAQILNVVHEVLEMPKS